MFKISVVMPLYNVGKFVEESIDSIIAQTIGFEENIKLILVNDGSVDNTEEICKKYLRRFPENIKYVYKENSGVSDTRNVGIQYLEGDFVVFFDGDDKWAPDAFAKMTAFLEKNDKEIDLVASRSCYFDRREGFENPLDYIFSSDRIVDVSKDYQCIQPVVNNVMFRKEAIEGVLFDPKLKMHEDTMFVSNVIVKKNKFGVLRSSTFFYRKRSDNSSAMDESRENLAWYFDVPKHCYGELVELSNKSYGKVIPYFQFLIMAIMQFAIKRPISSKLTETEKEEYREAIAKILQNIDDSIIKEQKSLNYAYKICALNLKHHCNILEKSTFDDNRFKFGNIVIASANAKNRLVVDNVELQNNRLYLSGNTHFGMFSQYIELGIVARGMERFVPCELFHMPEYDLYGIIKDKVRTGTGFRIEISLNNNDEFSFGLKNKRGKIIYPRITISQNLQDCFKGKTVCENENLIVTFSKNKFSVKKNNVINRVIANLVKKV